MTFLHWSLLGGAALIAVPIVLHMLMRRKPKHLEFPALRFVKVRQHANRRRLRFRQLLLLATRCLVIAMLALALARPSMQASGIPGASEAPVAAAMVFDTSTRLAYKQKNQTRLEQGRETGLWLINQLPAESDVAVVDSRNTGGSFAFDLGAARQRVERLATTAKATPLPVLIEDALRLVQESDKPRKEAYIFTDLASASWSAASSAALQRRLATLKDVGVYVVDIGAADPQNFSVAEIELSAETLGRGMPLRITARLAAVGAGGTRTAELFVLDANGSPQKRDTRSVEVPAGSGQSVTFLLSSLDEGIHQGYVKLAETDALPDDDIRFFTVNVRKAPRVLLASPAPADEYCLFLREALGSFAERSRNEAPFDCVVMTIDELVKQPLEDYAVVCLVDPSAPPPAAWGVLRDFVTSGGGLAVFLGRNAAKTGMLDSFNSPTARQLLAGKLARVWRAGQNDVYLAPETLQHPIFSDFRGVESGVPWSAFPVFRLWELDPLAEGVSVVAPYSNGLPALVERLVGQGRTLTMTTPVSDPASWRDTWNILPTGEQPWPFIALMRGSMQYLSGQGSTRLNYSAGDVATLNVRDIGADEVFALRTPSGDVTRQTLSGDRASLQITATELCGNYLARSGGEKSPLVLGFSVNAPSAAFELTRLAENDLKAFFGEAKYRVARTRDEIDRDISIGRVGVELFPYLIVLLALLSAAELALANRFYKFDDSSPAAVGKSSNAASETIQAASAAAAPALAQSPSAPLPSSTASSSPPTDLAPAAT